jgi:hypothetical protein
LDTRRRCQDHGRWRCDDDRLLTEQRQQTSERRGLAPPAAIAELDPIAKELLHMLRGQPTRGDAMLIEPPTEIGDEANPLARPWPRILLILQLSRVRREMGSQWTHLQARTSSMVFTEFAHRSPPDGKPVRKRPETYADENRPKAAPDTDKMSRLGMVRNSG